MYYSEKLNSSSSKPLSPCRDGDNPLRPRGIIAWIFRVYDFLFGKGEREHSRKVLALHEDVDLLTAELEKIKTAIHGRKAGELYPMIKEVIEPLFREVSRIQGCLHDEEGVVAYQAWTDKARHWVQLYSDDTDVEKMKTAIAEHIVQKSQRLIDRDIQSIHRYMDLHCKGTLEDRADLEAAVAPIIVELCHLKVGPTGQCFEGLNRWRTSHMDSRAEKYNYALKIIEAKCPAQP